MRDRAGLKGESTCHVQPQLSWLRQNGAPPHCLGGGEEQGVFGEEDPLQGAVSGDGAAEEEEGAREERWAEQRRRKVVAAEDGRGSRP